MEQGYELGFCDSGQIESVMEFFGREWESRHNFAVNKDYVDYVFFDKNKKRYNILIATNKFNGSIGGVLAYVSNNFFDGAIDESNKFIWITHWLCRVNGLGLKLLTTLYEYENTKKIGTIGNNQQASAIYKAFGLQTGKLRHYYMVNESMQSFNLLQGYAKSVEYIKWVNKTSDRELVDISHKDICGNSYPLKTPEFYKNKYLLSPYYKYILKGISDKNGVKAGFIFKAIHHAGAAALEIVEYFGNEFMLEGLFAGLQGLLAEYNAEYINFYCYGLDGVYLIRGGFSENIGEASRRLIVPEYFEPFRKENIEISFAFTQAHGMRIFKGDGDREHPRMFYKHSGKIGRSDVYG